MLYVTISSTFLESTMDAAYRWHRSQRDQHDMTHAYGWDPEAKEKAGHHDARMAEIDGTREILDSRPHTEYLNVLSTFLESTMAAAYRRHRSISRHHMENHAYGWDPEAKQKADHHDAWMHEIDSVRTVLDFEPMGTEHGTQQARKEALCLVQYLGILGSRHCTDAHERPAAAHRRTA